MVSVRAEMEAAVGRWEAAASDDEDLVNEERNGMLEEVVGCLAAAGMLDVEGDRRGVSSFAGLVAVMRMATA